MIQPLDLIIPGTATRDLNGSDVDKLLETYKIAEEAKDAFLEREITFDEYMQLLETAQVNVDSYLETVETNLETMKLL
ncbi:MAG: hypothetical protein HC939_23520 [Pleurocapsa sp. SU_5_0]|nr:hypothetical protein [Pleurocapsa sp. SU_5_0]NJO98635.1 hypothetical protein [Pleurocapsa sp. CRU_1_2]